MGGWFGGGNPSPYKELGTDPSAVTDVGFVYTNDVSAITELMYKNSAGTEVQITSGSGLNSTALNYPLLAPNGTAGAPSYSSSTAPTFGIYYETSGSAGLRIRLGPGTNTLPSVNLNTEASPIGIYKSGVGLGVIVAAAGASPQMLLGHFGHGATVIPSGGYYALHSGTDVTSGNPDTILNRDGAGIFAQRNTTNAQIFRVYNTWTDASNGEWLSFDWQTAANVMGIGTKANGTGTARAIRLLFSNSATIAFSWDSAAAGIGIGVYATTSALTAKVGLGRLGGGGSVTATSGTHTTVLVDESVAPTSTSTMICRVLAVTPTINYSAGTPGAGQIKMVYLNPTNTALPTGLNAALVLSSTASALGGIHFHNQTDEATNYELVRQYYTSNVFTIESTKGGTGTLRDISFVLNSETNVVSHISTATITGAVTDGYIASLRITPTYTAATAQTVTRHNYIDINNVTATGAGPAAVTDACVFRFNAAAGTHLAIDAGTTKTTPGTVDAWMIININGTLYYVPSYTSKTT